MATGTQTNASAADVLRALLDAGCPSLQCARIVAAQSALETAGWQGGLWNWNLGNITTAGSSYVTLPGNSLHFAAYSSLLAGAEALVHSLNSHGALTYAVNGDVQGFVSRLQAIGHAGNANYTQYQAGIQAWLTKLASVTPSPPWLQI